MYWYRQEDGGSLLQPDLCRYQDKAHSVPKLSRGGFWCFCLNQTQVSASEPKKEDNTKQFDNYFVSLQQKAENV